MQDIRNQTLNTQFLFAPDSAEELEDLLPQDYKDILVDLFSDDVAFVPEFTEDDSKSSGKDKKDKGGILSKTGIKPVGPTHGSQYHEGETHILDEFLGDVSRQMEFMQLKRQLQSYPKELRAIVAMALLPGSEGQSNTVVTNDDRLIDIFQSRGIDYMKPDKFAKTMNDSGLLNKNGLDLVFKSGVVLTDNDVKQLSDPALDAYVIGKVRAITDDGRRMAYTRNLYARLIGADKALALTNSDMQKIAKNIILSDSEGDDSIGIKKEMPKFSISTDNNGSGSDDDQMDTGGGASGHATELTHTESEKDKITLDDLVQDYDDDVNEETEENDTHMGFYDM